MTQLEKMRKEIEEIDDEMAVLFEKRMKTAREIALYKKKKDLPLRDKAREYAVLERCAAAVKDPEMQDLFAKVMRRIVTVTLQYEGRVVKEQSGTEE